MIVNGSQVQRCTAMFSSTLYIDYVPVFAHDLKRFDFIGLSGQVNGGLLLLVQNPCVDMSGKNGDFNYLYDFYFISCGSFQLLLQTNEIKGLIDS